MKKLIFFDLDGTLIPGNSWYEFNLYFGMSETEDKVLLDWYTRGLITYDEWDNLIVKILGEKNQITKDKVSEFVQTIEPRTDAKDVITKCKELGYTTIILSGTMEQIAESVRERLGADHSYTTSTIVFHEDGTFKDIANDKDEAPAKLRIFERICTEHGVTPEDTICIGDSGNDIAMFQKSKKAVLIGNYEKLKPFAWNQITELSEIIPLL